jgi:monoamine oxidase
MVIRDNARSEVATWRPLNWVPVAACGPVTSESTAKMECEATALPELKYQNRYLMARSPLFSSIKRALGRAKISQDHGIPADQVEEWVAEKRASAISRRDFLGKAAAAGAGFALMGVAPARMAQKASDLRIAIIGAGMAGLRAAHYLKQYGLSENVTLYESSNRTGGRMWTEKLYGNSGTTELGGEYIDYNHYDMLHLADLFGVKKLFRYKDKMQHVETFVFGNQRYTQKEVIDQFQFIREQVAKDSQDDENREALDQTSMKAYFDGLRKIDKVEGWFIDLLSVAYIGEMGLELEEQSALNFIDLIGAQEKGEFEFFGESDESIKFLGGNQQLCDRMAEELSQQIKLKKTLTKVLDDNTLTQDGYQLYFNNEAAPVYADVVIMTIPFTVLRKIPSVFALKGMTPLKEKCIRELGMGTNGKMFLNIAPMATTGARIWRSQGYQGYLYTNKIHTGWDSYHMQNYNEGQSVFTVFLGGKAGATVNAKEQHPMYLSDIDTAFNGVKGLFTNQSGQMNWTTYPHSLGSYICPKVGQVTEFVDDNVAGEPVGNMIFAGEHTSGEFSGFMNGAAESGRVAAEKVLKRIWDEF